MKAKIRFESITSTLAGVFILLIMNLAGCSKDDTSETTITGDLTTVPRTAASKGSYPIVGTRQTGIWDATGNSTSASATNDAFYGQDSQFAHTIPVYTKSSDGLTVKDEVTGLTWQKSYDSGTYYWAA
ncbi:MAG: hypothetical protein WCI54_10385, partial [Bacteroidia bacterium]